ncbi:MAG: ROK family protein, partial [Firmicutes bacterium]|nr:ROK family protein [Candidatus Caballimonas caccae]
MYSIGIDIGGMSIKIGLVDEQGRIVKSNRRKTEKTADLCIKNMVDQINELFSEYNLTVKDIKGIGVGCPGAVSREKGIVEFLPNLGWYNVDFVKELKKYFDTRIEISNDANVATLAEALYGVAKDYNSCIMFTLGTGVGGGIVLDKKLYEGGHSKGTELGHTTLIFGGKKCTCGRNGCIEQYVSATALIEQTKKEMIKNKASNMWNFVEGDINKVDGRTAFECAKKGDKSAIIVRDNYVKYLSESILN